MEESRTVSYERSGTDKNRGVLVVEWSDPEMPEGLGVEGYGLRCRKAGDADWTTSSLPSRTMHTRIAGLECGTEYRVQVRVRSTAGSGAWGKAEFAPTCLPDAPEIVAIGASNGGISVSWNRPNDGGSEITSYAVRATSTQNAPGQSSPSGHVITVPGDNNTYLIETHGSNRVYADLMYKVTVVVFNEVGVSNGSEPRFRCGSDPVPGAPAITNEHHTIEQDENGAMSFTVEWAAPDDAYVARPNAYEFSHRIAVADDEDENPWTTHTLGHDARSHTTAGATPGAAYETRVRARNGIGHSEMVKYKIPAQFTGAFATLTMTLTRDTGIPVYSLYWGQGIGSDDPVGGSIATDVWRPSNHPAHQGC